MGRTMDVGGPMVHYMEDGVGPPLLLLHGLGFSLFTFRKNIPFFARHMRTLALDLPGCGYSTLPDGYGASCEAMASYLKAFLDNLSIRQAVVCGAAEGGIYAMELACRYPDLVSALMLISPGSLTRHYPRAVKRLASQWMGPATVKAMKQDDMRDFLHWCFYNEISVDNYMVRQVYQPFEAQTARKTLLRLIAEYNDNYVHEQMKGFSRPMLTLWGEDDRGHPSGMADIYHNALPKSSVKLFRNCGMLPHEEKEKEFNHEAAAFLSLVRPQLDDRASDKNLFFDQFD